jgi:hypothetical protein
MDGIIDKIDHACPHKIRGYDSKPIDMEAYIKYMITVKSKPNFEIQSLNVKCITGQQYHLEMVSGKLTISSKTEILAEGNKLHQEIDLSKKILIEKPKILIKFSEEYDTQFIVKKMDGLKITQFNSEEFFNIFNVVYD